jgi:UDP-N-acetylglucosamine 1-carboxyvinyltransferase
MSSLFEVTGGSPLHGSITLAGAKNAATKILLATILSPEQTTLHNIPALGDVDITAELLGHLGTQISRSGNTWQLATPTISSPHVPGLSRKNRIPILALGPVLHRSGEVTVPVLGGDAIGPRPVDYHLAALKMMGAEIEVTSDQIRARAKQLHGAAIRLPYPSVGATENIILAAVLAQGRTTIRNAAIEPEVMDLVQMLQTMGALIELGTDRTFVIEGVTNLFGTTYSIMPDRNEAVSFACLALATNGDILVKGARSDHLMTWLNTVHRLGAHFEVGPEGIRFFRGAMLQATSIETDTHPGFMTDWQQPLATVLTQANGESVIHETVYEDRFGYTHALQTMGAQTETSTECLGTLACRWWGGSFQHSCRIKGPTPLEASTLDMPDIRAGMAHLVAAMVATGTSTLRGVEHLDRGYQRLAERLQGLGARLVRKESVYS